MKKVVEYENPICALSTFTSTDFEILDEKFKAIEENFYNMEFYCQHYKENQRVGGHTYELPITMLDRVEVCLNEAIDEFYLKLVKPVTVETYDGMARQEDVLHVEVVKEEIAVENDMDFIGHEKYNQLINDGEYCVGRTNSYYKELGTVNGNTYYYREL